MNVSKSRVAKKPVDFPSSLKMSIKDKVLTISNSEKSLSVKIPSGVNVVNDDGKIFVSESMRQFSKFAGMMRSVVRNFVEGLTSGFTKNVKLVGVGFKASVVNQKININLGYSHPIEFELPEGVTAVSSSATNLQISSHDKVLLGNAVAKMRKLRKRDAYKGKGVIDQNAQYQIPLKEGKKK